MFNVKYIAAHFVKYFTENDDMPKILSWDVPRNLIIPNLNYTIRKIHTKRLQIKCLKRYHTSEKPFFKLWAYLMWLILNDIKMKHTSDNNFDLDKDKFFIGYQFVIISELSVSSSRSRSSYQDEILTGLGCTHVMFVTRMQTLQRRDHEGRNKST